MMNETSKMFIFSIDSIISCTQKTKVVQPVIH